MAYLVPTVQLESPTEAETVIATASILILKPAAPLLSLTVNMPANPSNEYPFILSTTAAITTVVLVAAGTVFGSVTSLMANSPQRWMYLESQNSWFRV